MPSKILMGGCDATQSVYPQEERYSVPMANDCFTKRNKNIWKRIAIISIFPAPWVYFNFEKVKIVLTPAQLIPNRVNIKNEKKLLLIVEVTKIWSSDQPWASLKDFELYRRYKGSDGYGRVHYNALNNKYTIQNHNLHMVSLEKPLDWTLDYRAYWKVDADYLYLNVFSN